MKMKNWLRSMITGIALCGAVSAMSATIDKIIVFGDSLSDNGNVYSMLSAAKNVIPLVPLIPKTPPYFEGHFTNGLVWVENLAKTMNVPLVNYAYGGAWAEGFYDSHQILPPSLGTQIDMYTVMPSTVVDYKMHQHLYIIWSGANDYLHGRTDIDYASTKTVDTIGSQIDWLARMGAKHFLIVNMPDLSRAPSAIERGPDFAVNLQKVVDQHNEKLANKIKQLSQQYPKVDILYVSVSEMFDDLVLNPSKYQLKNVTQPCYTGGYQFAANRFALDPEVQAAQEAKFEIANNSVLMDAYVNSVAASKGQKGCDNPDEFLFWDKTHPSRVGHQLIGLAVFEQLAKTGILSA